jgi:hypothetical protein
LIYLEEEELLFINEWKEFHGLKKDIIGGPQRETFGSYY